ncbi:hypothetical protein VP01_624g3 [Puccinia sorghi]|uniref:Uncharacterized protein n=1 Tax=Puccinia sorghi TaxID=27349 RepID=A0A0L6UGI0_9BASI|nr:hypothetical protein VP01_624g3 [Puccinia sorghi]
MTGNPNLKWRGPKGSCKNADYNYANLKTHIEIESYKIYKKESKSLTSGHHAKSSSCQKYIVPSGNMFWEKSWFLGVVMVLNPLDDLGDNQVAEKISAGFSVINLTARNFDSKKGHTSNMEYEMLSTLVQKFVVEKAHMIYSWGLVKSGKHHWKNLMHHQDVAPGPINSHWTTSDINQLAW